MSAVTTRRVRSIALGAALGLVLGLAPPRDVVPRGHRPAPRTRPTRSGWATSPTSRTPRRSSASRRASSRTRSATPRSSGDLQRGARRRSRRSSSDSLDVSYIGPNPTVSAFVQSRGGGPGRLRASRPVGRTSSSSPTSRSATDLEGKTLATPSARQHPGRRAPRLAEEEGPRDRHRAAAATSSIQPQDNASRSRPSRTTTIDGAWVPEPWATRLVDEGGGKILVDEADLWPDGKYVTTNLLVRKDVPRRATPTRAGAAHRPRRGGRLHQRRADSRQAEDDVVEQDRSRHRQADRPGARDRVVRQHLVHRGPDPRRRSQKSAKDAASLGLPGAVALTKADLKDLYNLKLLNKVLKKNGQPDYRAAVTAGATAPPTRGLPAGPLRPPGARPADTPAVRVREVSKVFGDTSNAGPRARQGVARPSRRASSSASSARPVAGRARC